MNTGKFERFHAILTALFEAKGISEVCPYCSNTNWLVMDWNRDGTYVKEEGMMARELGGAFLMLTCSNCGNIRLIDPDVLGITPPEIAKLIKSGAIPEIKK